MRERCKFCGFEMLEPCETPPADICAKAINWPRGSGRTFEQMCSAPPDAWYVWPNTHFEYARALALYLGRLDLRFMSAERYKSESRYMSPRARRLTVAIDHACEVAML